MTDTINLDFRSLVRHFENGVWMYRCHCIRDIKADFEQTFEKSIFVDAKMAEPDLPRRALRSMVKVFSPLLLGIPWCYEASAGLTMIQTKRNQ